MFERLESSAFIKEAPFYLDRGLHIIYSKLAFRSNLILVGPKGTGKSLSVASYAASLKVPTVTFDCSEDARRSQLIGMFILRGQETPFVLGPLTTAYEVANEMGSCILILEEINTLTPQMQKVLNPVSDFRNSLEVPEVKTVFKLRSGAKLWVVGTMNSSSYGGVYPLNEDLKSRFRMLPIEYPDPSFERKVLNEFMTKKELKDDFNLVDRLLTLAKETRQGKMDYALSTRDLIQIIEDFYLVGVDAALLMIVGKYEDAYRTAFIKRVQSIFGIDLKPIK